jgi:hypothetical protein
LRLETLNHTVDQSADTEQERRAFG